jgi:hypothetical protein
MIHIGTTYTPKKAKIGQKLCKNTLIPYPISFCGRHLNQSAEGRVEAWTAPSGLVPLVGRAEAVHERGRLLPFFMYKMV